MSAKNNWKDFLMFAIRVIGEWSQWRYVVRDDAIHPNPNLYAFRPPYRGVPYRWRVQAKNGSDWSRWSSWAYFLVL